MNSNNFPKWWVAFIPFGVLTICLYFVIKIFGTDSLNGASEVALLIGAGVASAISIFGYKIPWKVLENAIVENIRSVGTSLMILFLIGAVAGTWMASGVVPTLIYYGIHIISPGVFLLVSCVVCAGVSLMTGSSWTTIATIGVALIGVGTALGFSPGWTAGAIISGAYFGDKISPLSDTTVLASSSVEVNIFDHIRYMLITTVPSFLIACTVFLVVSLCGSGSYVDRTDEFGVALRNTYNLSPWLLVVPVITVILIIKRVPAIVTLFSAATMAAVAALIAQPHIVMEVATGIPTVFRVGPEVPSDLNFYDGLRGIFQIIYGDAAVQTGSEALDELVATSGMTGMLNTVFLILCAVTFGGVLSGSGMLASLTLLITKHITRLVSLVASTAATGIFFNIVSGDQYISIIMSSQFYREAFRARGLEDRLLSRTVEDSTTVTSVLVPWNSCGMTQATVLGVPTIVYLPYCIFNLISPLMSILIAGIGYKVMKRVL